MRLCFRVRLMTCLRIKAYSAKAPKTNNMQANNQISRAVTWLATGMRALYSMKKASREDDRGKREREKTIL